MADAIMTPANAIQTTGFSTDEPLWYNNGVYGALGYAVPNFGFNARTLNQGIAELVDILGRNLSAIMHVEDVDMRTPPLINTLVKVHKLVLRARTIINSRAVPEQKPMMEGVHDVPDPQDFTIYPVPYFKVRNRWLKTWCGLVMSSLTEACRHTENRRSFDYSTAFGGLVGQYLQRVYQRMAIELFMVDPTKVADPNFVLDDATLASYSPSKVFTATELIDTPPATYAVPTADDLQIITDGIPATKLVNLQKFPSTALPGEQVSGASAATAGATGANPTGGAGAPAAFPPPPGP